LDEDIDKRMSFVEKHDIFAILPGYISEMTFADWLQNNVIRVLELKFYPHVRRKYISLIFYYFNILS